MVQGRWRKTLAGVRSRRVALFVAFTIGVASVFVARAVVNSFTFPELLVRPLLYEDTAGNADMIVVAGAGVTGRCTPNLNAERRVLLAARLFRAGRAPGILFTGGSTPGIHCSVAGVMADLAREIGVPSDRIHVETDSRSTFENAERSTPLLHALGATRVLLVTDRLHMPRTQACFERFGFAVERASVPVADGHRDNVDMLFSALREMVAIRYYKAVGWLGDFEQPSHAFTTPGPALDACRGRGDHAVAQAGYVKNPNGPIVILGASYAGDWRVERLNGIPVVNRGVSGQQSFELLARFEKDVVPLQPRAVLVWGFINDLFRTPREKVESAEMRVRESFARMIQLARTHGVEPIVATEITVRPRLALIDDLKALVGRVIGRQSYHDYINREVLELNRWLREYAACEGVLLLDIQPTLSDASGKRRRAYAAPDGSHISQAGYDALARYIDVVLERRVTPQ